MFICHWPFAVSCLICACDHVNLIGTFYQFKNILGGEPSITKQSFSEARQKILPSAFVQMFYNIVEWYYGDDYFKKFMGFMSSGDSNNNDDKCDCEDRKKDHKKHYDDFDKYYKNN